MTEVEGRVVAVGRPRARDERWIGGVGGELRYERERAGARRVVDEQHLEGARLVEVAAARGRFSHHHFAGQGAGDEGDLAALALAFRRKRPARGRVVLLFQPAEENGAGAAAVLADAKFKPLTPEIIPQVVQKFVMQLEAQLSERGVTFDLDKAAVAWLADKGYDERMGARPLGRVIQEQIKKPLADEVPADREAHHAPDRRLLEILDGKPAVDEGGRALPAKQITDKAGQATPPKEK